MKKLMVFVLLTIFGTNLLLAQKRNKRSQRYSDLVFDQGRKKVDIPFEYHNSFIVVKVLFNDIFPLKFIFDTGAENTVLTKREITDILNIDYRRKFTLLGSDLSTELYAYLAQGINLKIDDLFARNQSILVLADDYIKFTEYVGVEIHGILGADLFRRFVVQINYARRVITLYDPVHFKPPNDDKTTTFPIEIKRNKPYLFANTTFSGDTIVNTKLLVDTGASLSLLLHARSHPNLNLPPNIIPSNIAMGLGGYLEGFLGRVNQIDLGGYRLTQVITNFQDLLPGVDSSYLNNRNGILGNQILNRFTVTIDYIRSNMYLRPNKRFKQKFKYDRSGLSIVVSGKNLNQYTVLSVVPGSPADVAGVKSGDEIKKVNGMPVFFLQLDNIVRKLQKKPGKKVRLVLLREGKKIKVSFQLRDLI